MHLPSFSSVVKRAVTLVILSAGLSACSTHFTAPVEQIGGAPRFLDDGKQHLVNGGETLYAIAWMYDLDVNALARANNLSQPYAVTPGMLLSVDPRVVSGVVPNTTAAVAGAAVASAAPVGTAVVTAVPSIGGLRRTPLPSTPLPANNTASASSSEPAVIAPSSDATPLQGAAEAGIASASATPVVTPPLSTPAPTTARVVPPASEPPPVLPKSEPSPAPAAGSFSGSGNIAWDWPHRGNILARFTDSSVEGKGVDLAGKAGDAVLAAADGEVVYAGGGLQRYGNLLILKHNDHFLSAYAHNRSLLVKEGDVVKRGQKIAELGNSGVDRDMLHFEIRQDGKPVDPLTYLPSR
jgi:lipoprotein NlpD